MVESTVGKLIIKILFKNVAIIEYSTTTIGIYFLS